MYSLFPSPFGVISISMYRIRSQQQVRVWVSVPFRGYLYFNTAYTLLRFPSSLFPSPFGVISISISSTRIEKIFLIVSVPFRGYLYFNDDKITIKSFTCVSVPFRGYLYFNCGNRFRKKKSRRRFRPLSGLSLFQFTARTTKPLSISVSVPFRGYLYFNTYEIISLIYKILFPSPFGVISISIRTEEEQRG